MGTESRVAVIGMACRLPGGADNPEELWSMLAEGRDGWGEVPKDRWNWRSFYHKDPETKEAMNFSHGYFLDQDISAFDAKFFGLPAAEVTGIDPQQRLLLEITYEAIEDAGIPIESLRGSDTSVHMAMFARDYDRMGYTDGYHIHKSHIQGSGDAILSNRISYILDLKGSSNTLDTGCSGSLVALHQACRTLRSDDATLAIAGASQLLLTPDQSIAMTSLGTLINKDGKCYTFDDRGAGYGRGEGVGVLVLKRLDRALADGDAIHAVILDSGVGHDGKTSGILLPNADAQAALATSVYAKVGIDPCDTLYVEAHGTGTVAGDKAEIQSISQVFGREARRKSDLPVGSIKSNIGHLESSSGVAGVIKAIMVLKKNQVPPNLNFINPKPSLNLEERGIKVPLELSPLTPQGYVGPRRVSVNSFGYGGTNAHAILEAHDCLPNSNSNIANGNEHQRHIEGFVNGDEKYQDSGVTRLVALSANSEKSLDNVVSSLRQWLKSDQGSRTPFNDLAYTLNVRRSKLPWRCGVLAKNIEELESALKDPGLRPVRAAKELGVAFFFTGQGAQWYAMGRELLKTSQVFASSIASCKDSLKSLGCDWDLVEELCRNQETSQLSDSRFSQPATTAVQVALVDLIENFGIRPDTVCGHSSGEVAAAYAAGVLGRDAAMQVAYHRGICSSMAKSLNTEQGAMMAVGEGEEAVTSRIQQIANGKLTVACVNSPESTTISGDQAAINELKAALDTESIFNRQLKVDSAYHSHHMEAVAQLYLSSLDGLSHDDPRTDVAFYSSVTGTRKLSEFGPSYWVSNLVSQVKFSTASQLVAKHLAATPGANLLIEVGPHSALAGPLRQTLSSISGGSFEYTYTPSLVRNQSAVTTILSLLGKAFEIGVPVQLQAVMNDMSTSERPYQVLHGLPTYPWDHTSSYWHESRLSKGHRLRPFPYHDLVGLLDVGSNTHEPRWRYHVSVQSLPWLQDHIVEGFVIFPGAGYITMVTEAMKQLFHLRQTSGHIKGIHFRDVTFKKSVVISGSQDDGSHRSYTPEVELQLTLSPARQHEGSHWEYFRVLSHDDQSDTWSEHCTGIVSLETEALVDEVEGSREDNMSIADTLEALQKIQAGSSTPINPTGLYDDLAASGNSFGPSFQGLKKIHVGSCCGLANVVVQDIAQIMPGQYMQPHLIHPTTFDAVNQLQAAVFRRECSVAPVMPVVLGELWISADIDNTPGAELKVALNLLPEGSRTALGNSCAYQKQRDGTLRPVLTASGIRLQVVGEADSGNTKSPKQRDNYKIEWKPDVDYLTQNHFMNRVSDHKLLDVGYGTLSKLIAEDQLRLNDQVATIFIRKALDHLRQMGISDACTPHLSKLLSWMLSWSQSEFAGRLLEGVKSKDEESVLIDQAKDDNIVGFILSRFGPRLVDIFTGKADALEVLLEDDLLGRHYSEYTLFSSHYAQVAEYMKAVVHKNPNMKILEIGAGTGSASMPLMESIDRSGRLLLEEYTYTDISSGFFERARSKFSQWSDQIDFKTLDISRDPLEQGFSANSFDLIVASIVLHATPLMDVTMSNVRRLLKPGGRLVLMELTGLAAATNTVFGTLEGWWMSEDGRKDGPLLTVPQWDSLLRRHGFSGTDIAIPAHLGPSSHLSSMMVSKATLPHTRSQDQDEGRPKIDMKASVCLGYSESSQQTALGDDICLSLRKNGVLPSQQPWDTITTEDPDSLVIVIDSAEHALLLDPAYKAFEQTKHILLQGRNVLWISFQESPRSETGALKNMINGMARVIRRENPSLRLVTVDVQDDLQHSFSNSGSFQGVSDTISEIAISSFWPTSEATRLQEWEYAICDRKVTIPRVVSDDHYAAFINSRNNQEGTMANCNYLDKDRPLMLDVQVPGLLNTLRFVDNDNLTSKSLGPDLIEIQARAYGVNFKDVFIALGQMRPGVAMTGEVAGVITAVGSNLQSAWKPGDRVIGLMVDPFGNQVARLESGQSILIHAASGGVGQAAIQIAKLLGAKIYATVGSAAKRALIQDHYGIPDSHIFSSHSRNFKKGIMRLTHGQGVDAVLNSLSGEFLMDSWDCVAPFGTFLEIGKTDIYEGSQLNMANFEKQATFAAVDTSHMYRLRPEYVCKGLAEIFGMVDKGLLKPVHPVTSYPVSRIEEAFRLIAARKHIGKLVLVADDQTVVQAPRPKPKPLRLHGNGTYIIGGGLGDLGKRMVHLLAERGAGHIVTLSRRSVDSQQRALLEEGISKLGATLHIFKCDIADESSVRAATEEIAELPPVKGIIQSALVLRDHPLEYMQLEDWLTALKPKVWGTLNIHKALCSPEQTDFFIMLSSVSSIIGATSQSNYNAGNAFQDAFAHAQNHISSHTKYVTINVGAIEGSDQIKLALNQNSDIARAIGYVSFEELVAALEYAMGSQALIDEAKQCIMSFDRDSMEYTMGETALRDHLFDHVPSRRKQERNSNNSSTKQQPTSAAQAIERVESVQDAENIVKQALLDKFAAFIGHEVPADQPVVQLGLDSLVSIEIKNWVKHTFKVTLQASALSNAPSIISLAKLIVSKMKLKCREK
ncbi:hypothetical protein VMCG_02438 [Cytospora schulzeri]|uniref:Uncharacterized protein n=1 Tax=Cytospora schulzeri TaxID=448051 RepID=A0A423X1I4_9PEZI|nr:hypothetical protein VMCG_02438 [Valsa malicola]